MNMIKGLGWALLALPVLEIAVLVKMIGTLGFTLTVLLLLSAAMLGSNLIRQQGFTTWFKVQQGLARGEIPARDMIESALLGFAGLLLLIPGFISDLVALLCLFPGIRRYLAGRILANAPPIQTPGHPPAERTIEGEFRREE